MKIYSDEVLENAIKSYEVAKYEPLSEVTYSFLKELKEYRKIGTLEELEELENELMMV